MQIYKKSVNVAFSRSRPTKSEVKLREREVPGTWDSISSGIYTG